MSAVTSSAGGARSAGWPLERVVFALAGTPASALPAAVPPWLSGLRSAVCPEEQVR
jgi:hypothetical protein